jgi:hypothetical protein
MVPRPAAPARGGSPSAGIGGPVPPPASRRRGGTGGAGAAWAAAASRDGHGRTGAVLVDVPCAAPCAGVAKRPAAGSGDVAPSRARRQRGAPHPPASAARRAGDRTRAGPSTRLTLDALALPPEATPDRGRSAILRARPKANDHHAPQPSALDQSRAEPASAAPSRRAPPRPADRTESAQQKRIRP